MLEQLAKEASKSLWKEVGEEAVKKAVSTFVGEGIKAVIEIWKSRHITEQNLEIKDRHKQSQQVRDEEGAGDGGDDAGEKPQ